MDLAVDYGDPRLPDRFWDKVHPEPMSGCWLWSGAVHSSLPYGIWRANRRTCRAHVSVYRIGRDLLPAQVVRHTCDTPPCVNPRHLTAGTQAENVDDMIRRGRRVYAKLPPKQGPARPRGWRSRSHCVNGHEFTQDNTYWKPNERCRDGVERACRTCRTACNRRQAARRKAARAARNAGV